MSALRGETLGSGQGGSEAMGTHIRGPKLPKPAVPAVAGWLGGLGAVPFVLLALAALVVGEARVEAATFALAAYGAVILSFLGGVHWGAAMAGDTRAGRGRRLVLSVLPSLVAWPALLLPVATALFVLATGFMIMLVVDLWASAAEELPPWYPRLRWPLTVIVVASLVIGALA